MKYSFAVLALLGLVTGEQLEHHRHVVPYIDNDGYIVMQQDVRRSKNKKDKPSNEICDGDSADDKQLEHEGDDQDDIVEDFGFSGSRGAMRRAQIGRRSLAQKQHRIKSKDKPSDEICDGDSADDKQLEHEGDQNDDIVEDHGFSGSRGHTIRLQTSSESMTNAQLNAMLNARAKMGTKKTSDYLCDGDSADDKEIQDTADGEDDVVEDFGFSGSRNARGQVRLLQLSDEKYSNQLANGDRDDDKELEKEHDMTDDIVDFNGHTNAGYAHTRYDIPNEPYKFDNAHYADNNIKNLFPDHFGTIPRESFIQLEGKPEQAEYAAHRTGKDWDLIQTMSQKTKEEVPDSSSFLQMDASFEDFPINQEHMNLLFKMSKYSDELANGDVADDKELEKEHDMTDMIVDFNGHTNAGYAHTPYDDPQRHYAFDNAHYANNNIQNLFPEHFGTVPRAD